MNQILTGAIAPGVRQPFSKRTLAHLQSNFPLLAAGLSRLALADPAAVVLLDGAETSGSGTITVTAGVALYAGELLEVPAHTTVIAPAEVAGWSIVESYLTGDPVVMSNSTTANVHQLRQLRVISAPTVAVAVDAAVRFTRETLDGGQVQRQGSWQPLTLAGSVGGSAEYLRLSSGVVLLRGSLTVTATPSAIVLGTLPAGFRPSVLMSFPRLETAGAFRYVYLTGAGELQTTGGGSGTVSLTLDGICFLAEL